MTDASEIPKQPTTQESEGVFRAIFEQAAVGVAQVVSRTGAFVRINRRYAEILGYTVAEMERLTYQQITHPHDLQKGLDNMKRLLAGEIREFSTEKRYCHKDGSIVWGKLTVSPMWPAGEEPNHHIAVVEDITVSKRAEESLRENERFLQLVFDSIQDGISVLDRHSTIIRANRWMEDKHASEAPLEGKKCFAVYQQRISPCPWCPTVKTLETGVTHKSVVPYPNAEAPEGWVELSAFPLKDAEGEITGVIEYAKDITDSRRAEQAMREAKSFSESLIETANAIVVVLDRQGEITVFNSTAERITGYTAEELGGKNWFEVLVPRERYPEVWGEFERLMAGGVPQEFENPILTKGGEERHIVWKNSELIRDGQVAGTVSFGIDITERKQAEEALRESEERHRLAQRLSAVGTWEWNVATGDIFWSDEVLSIWGLNRESLVGTYDEVAQYIHPDDVAGWQENVRACVEDGREHNTEFRIIRPDGTVRWVAAFGDAHRDEHGKALRMVGVVMDVTERKQAEREREELIARLEAQNAELERFTYTVSHDLKSPLITIKGYIGLLTEDLHETCTESVRSDLAKVSNAADKMGVLLEDLLELSRIGRLTNPPEVVSLGELAHDAMELLQGQLEDKFIRVEVLPDLPVVCGDRIRLREVLQNLIDNAVKYMGDNSRPLIEIGARQDGDQTTCFVRDNGIGIEPPYHDTVFGLFDQLDPSTEGTGVGLALVKRIIEVHGGRIWIESEGKGRGSTFCFTLPETAS